MDLRIDGTKLARAEGPCLIQLDLFWDESPDNWSVTPPYNPLVPTCPGFKDNISSGRGFSLKDFLRTHVSRGLTPFQDP